MRKIDWFAGALLLIGLVIGSLAAVGTYHVGMAFLKAPKTACSLALETQ